MSLFRHGLSAVALVAVLGACSDGTSDRVELPQVETRGSAAGPQVSMGIDDATLVAGSPSGEQWLTYGRDYAETRYSPLDQIDAANVARLGLAWYYDTKSLRVLEGTPLIADGVLYGTTSWSNVFALDARTGRELWYWDAQANRERGSKACCDVANRGVALYGDKVYVGVIDGRLVALDAASGRPVWDVQTTPTDKPYTITGAPRIVEGKVIIGNGGAELGTRGFVSAYDAETGGLLWRFYIVPGNPALGFESPAMEEAARTWTGEWWVAGGGGTPWDAIAYDAEARLLYVGTGNGSPWVRRLRSPEGGDNLYLSSIIALDVDTGELVWHYQTTPGDNWDYTAVQQLTLADLTIDGVQRKVIMQAPKNGFFYVLDRVTGELLSAEPITRVTWAKGVDLASGRPIETMQARYGRERTTISPGPGGAHNWQPMSYNPNTGLVYIPVSESSFVYADDPSYRYIPGAWNLGVSLGTLAGVPERDASQYEEGTGEAVGSANILLAWDPVAQAARWRVPLDGETGGGTLTTAGNLVFQGKAGGALVAYSADNGERLWEVNVGSGILAPPVTYMLDGRQYLSVLVGWGGAAGLYRRSPPGPYKAEGRLYTFVLDGDTNIPRITGIDYPELTPIDFDATPEQVARGADVFGQRCSMCHGTAAESSGTIADLRYAAPATLDIFQGIVQGGAYLELGMPRFDFLSDADVDALRSYVLTRRAETLAARR
jgi:quinohemoprotein ethanol dehydrogenase